MRHIPNILSTFRLMLVGVFVWQFVAGNYLPALSVYIFAFFTDILDGQLARKHNWISDLGKLLDPLADKLMTIAALICIYIGKREIIYFVLCALVFSKELLMLIGGLFMAHRKVVAFALWPGKLATGLFAVGVVLSLISFLPAEVEPWNLYILILATALSYYALFFYGMHQLPRAFHKKTMPTDQGQDADK
ncbi:MAG: CDP-alcohol phosphatidyltransferase family protein [Clostridia bacterium]